MNIEYSKMYNAFLFLFFTSFGSQIEMPSDSVEYLSFSFNTSFNLKVFYKKNEQKWTTDKFYIIKPHSA